MYYYTETKKYFLIIIFLFDNCFVCDEVKRADIDSSGENLAVLVS